MILSNEFIDYVNAIIKENNGAVDDDVLFKAAMKMRELPKTERNWGDLSQLVKWNGTPEGYRSWFRRRLDESNDNTTKETTDEQFSSDELSKYQVRNEWTAYRKLIRDEARLKTFKDELITAISKQEPLRINKSSSCMFSNGIEAILMLSDWHIGQDTDNFYNKYNKEIARQRVEKVVDRCIDYCHEHRITKLNVLNLGDLIEGLIHVNARLEQGMDVVEEIIYASELMANALLTLSENVSYVTYREVTDNHTRMVADKNQSIESENCNRIITWYLKERLKNAPVHFIDDNLSVDIGKFTLNNGKRVVFTHGHNDQKDKTLQNVVGATREWIDVVCCGHFHNPAEHTFQDMKLFINGSLCGTGPYALSKRLFCRPSQKLIIFNDDDYIDVDINV